MPIAVSGAYLGYEYFYKKPKCITKIKEYLKLILKANSIEEKYKEDEWDTLLGDLSPESVGKLEKILEMGVDPKKMNIEKLNKINKYFLKIQELGKNSLLFGKLNEYHIIDFKNIKI